MSHELVSAQGRYAKELAEGAREPSSELHGLHVSSFDTEALEEGSSEYADALGVYGVSDIVGEVEAAGGVLVGVQRSRVMSNPWLTSVVFSVLGGRAKLYLNQINPTTQLMIKGTSGSHDLNYMFVSVYEDGAADLTWGRPTVMTPSTPQLGSWPGSGDFSEDLGAHRRRVEEREAPAYLHEDMEDVKASTLFYESQLVPEAMLAYIYASGGGGAREGKQRAWPIVAGVLVALFLWWLWTILSRHGG